MRAQSGYLLEHLSNNLPKSLSVVLNWASNLYGPLKILMNRIICYLLSSLFNNYLMFCCRMHPIWLGYVTVTLRNKCRSSVSVGRAPSTAPLESQQRMGKAVAEVYAVCLYSQKL